MKKLGAFDWFATLLVIIGGLNWGLVGFFKWNLVDAIFGADSTGSRVVYAVVGLAALYVLAIMSNLGKKE
ncbi:MAG: DUF378 domain-containing protein [Patescibacteria group bacterium]|jgi:hypothetical protein